MKNTPFYVINKWYCLTINPEDRYQQWASENRYVNFMRWFKNEMTEIFGYGKTIYVGNVELSEPRELNESKGPRLHFHGMFRFKDNSDIFKFLLLGLNRMARMGHVNIDTVGDLAVWTQYCRKHEAVMPTKTCSLSNHYTVWDHYVANTLDQYEAPEGLPQGRGSDGLAKEAQADVSEGSEASVATKPVRRKRCKRVSIKDWVNPLDAEIK